MVLCNKDTWFVYLQLKKVQCKFRNQSVEKKVKLLNSHMYSTESCMQLLFKCTFLT